MPSIELDNSINPNGELDRQHSQQGNESQSDYYWENGFLVFTASYLIQRGWCCGNGCRHCPYEPKHHKGNRLLDKSRP